MVATIKVEFSPGDSIEDAFLEAIRLAKLLGVGIEFQFNSVKCWACPQSDVDNGIKAYHVQLQKKDGHKFAVA